MNTKDILGNLNARIDFADQVACGVGNVYRDFAKSPHGQNIKADDLDATGVRSQAHGGAGLITLVPEDNLRSEVDVTIFAHGRIEVRATQVIANEQGARHEVGLYEIEFDPEADHAEGVAARVIGATLALPANPISERLADFVATTV